MSEVVPGDGSEINQIYEKHTVTVRLEISFSIINFTFPSDDFSRSFNDNGEIEK